MNWLKHNYVWYSALLGFILFIAWFTSSPSFEPAIGIVATGSALFGHFIKNKSPNLSDLNGKKKSQLITLLENDTQDSSSMSKQKLIERIINLRLQTLEGQKKLKLYSLFASIMIAIILGFYFRPTEEGTAKKNSGVLVPPTISEDEVLVKKFAVGSTNFEIESEEGVWLADGNLPLIQLKIRNNKLLVSAEIFDNQYKKVSYIADNEWHVNQNNCERNYTDNIVEIKNQRGDVVLQAIHFGNTVHLAFQLYSRNGWRMTLMPEYYVFDNYKGESLTELFNKTSVFRYGKIFIPVDKQLVFEDKIEVIKQAHPFIGAVWSLEPSSLSPRYWIPSICDYPRDLSPEKCEGEKIVDLFIDANGALFSTNEALTMHDYQSEKGDRPLYIIVSGMRGEFLSEEQKRLEADNYRN